MAVIDSKILANNHNLRLPKWGPYTKKYMGISHVPTDKKGIRFDLSIFPGYYRKRVDIPNVMWESGYHPWEAAPDLSYFSHRHELEWKDKVYSDISFSKLDDKARLIRCHCVNNTDIKQNIVLHFMASISFPPRKIYSPEVIVPAEIKFPYEYIWVNAVDYSELEFKIKTATDNLVPDGFIRGEIRDNGFIEGSALGRGFGNSKGDKVNYKINVEQEIEEAVIVFRYRITEEKSTFFQLSGIIDKVIEFKNNECEFNTLYINVGDIKAGSYNLELLSLGGTPIELDGFLLLEGKNIKALTFDNKEWNFIPQILSTDYDSSIILKYDDLEEYYGITWDFKTYEIRQFFSDELDMYMRHNVHHHTSSIFKGNGKAHYMNTFLRPIELQEHSDRDVYGLVCNGTLEEVRNYIADFQQDCSKVKLSYEKAYTNAIKFNTNEEGEKYLFSQKRMATTTLTNVVYPVYMRRGYIKHNTPGRWWDCLYTWDSGFIGLGLAELDIQRAVDCLNAYVTEPGDTHSAFIHHGSPVPVQFYLYQELWNKTQSRELLEFFYPRLQQYHRFLCGRLGSSTTNKLKSGLIKTWDYFYNSGGWDDYPPQVHVHKNKLTASTTPVSNTAHCIRTAKILKMAAYELGLYEDIKEYDMDVEYFSKSILEYCWDEKEGYFGYLCHDENGNPNEILKHESGKNYNMGLDGAYPLVAGICNEEQERRLVEHLSSEDHMWTAIGLSTVDKAAPYYKLDGYWNGAVWMPHQWFFWKTMLDLGKGELAYKIANTGLDVWKREVDESYNCFEHFIIQSGRGAGWHHFSGLSTPVLTWFKAYHTSGTITCGFDTWIIKREFKDDNSYLYAELRNFISEGRTVTILVGMNSDFKYLVKFQDREILFKELSSGIIEISLEFLHKEGRLEIIKQQNR